MLKQVKLLGLVTVMSLGLNMVGCTDVENTNTSEPVKQEQHLEENKRDNKEEVKEEKREEVKEEKREEAMAQCYDCGQYKPIKGMSFNGRSYHCGCANKCCLYCNQEIPYGKEICVDDTLYFCNVCYSEYMNDIESSNQVQCDNCGESVHTDDTIEVDGYVFCSYCYNNGAATWTCENCGSVVPLGEMCECEYNN